MIKPKMRKKGKSKEAKIQVEIWDNYCKPLIRKKYGNVCYTCGATGLTGPNWHTGHLIPKAVLGAYLKYDLRVLRPQCYSCNIHHGGMGAVFIEKMRQIEGDEYVDQILKDRQITVKAIDQYTKILEEYKKLAEVELKDDNPVDIQY